MLTISRVAGLLRQRSYTNATAPAASATVSDSVSATVREVIEGGVDLLPLPGRYLTAPANESVVSVRLRTQTTAACGRPDWDTALHVGCFQVGLSVASRWSAYAGVTALHTASFDHGGQSKLSLERCEAECRGRAAKAFAVFDGAKQCACLSAEPNTDASVPRFNCSQTCGADEAQICGGEFAQTCSALSLAANPPRCAPYTMYASIYRMLLTSDWDGTGLPCRFELTHAYTPSITSALPSQLAVSDVLTIAVGDLLMQHSNGPPAVSVCGGVPCPRLSSNATHILCRMPTCSVAATEPVVVHVPPLGYASHPSHAPIVVRGVLTVSGVRLEGGSNTSAALAEGSAAGGVRLVVSGSGFDDATSTMLVQLVDAGPSNAIIAGCRVLSSSASKQQLTCVTTAAEEPLVAAGTLCSVRVSVLGANGASVAAAHLASSYQLLGLDDSIVLSSVAPSAGSTEGGLTVCLDGTHLDRNRTSSGASPPMVLLGSSPCIQGGNSTTWNATRLCCVASPASSNLALSAEPEASASCSAALRRSRRWLAPSSSSTIFCSSASSALATVASMASVRSS